MDKSYIRNSRIQTLTKMALRGSTYEELLEFAMHNVSRKTAEDYLLEVSNRLNKINYNNNK